MSYPLGDHRRLRKDAVNLGGEIVEIRVGSERRPFYVHSTIIQNSSAFFRAALSERWTKKKGKDKPTSMELPEDDPATIHDYLRYLYTGHLFTEEVNAECCSSMEDYETGIRNEWRSLFQLYVLAVKLQDDTLTLRVLESMLSKSELDAFYLGFGTYDDINILYRGTTSGSPGRRVLVDMILWSTYYELSGIEDASLYDPEFLFELTSVLLQKHNHQVEAKRPDHIVASWYIHNTGYASIHRGPYQDEEDQA